MRFRAGAGRRMSMSGRTVWHGTAVSVFCPAQVLRTPTQFHRRAAPRTHRHHEAPSPRTASDIRCYQAALDVKGTAGAFQPLQGAPAPSYPRDRELLPARNTLVFFRQHCAASSRPNTPGNTEPWLGQAEQELAPSPVPCSSDQ